MRKLIGSSNCIEFKLVTKNDQQIKFIKNNPPGKKS